MPRPIDCDVAIVGAGPAGASTALFLVHAQPRLAERIVVVDKARFPRDKFCGGAIGRRADDRLASIGVHIDVPSAILHGVSVALRRGTVCRRIGDIGRVIRRMEFDHALLAAVRARGVRVWEGTPVRAIDARDDRIVLHTGESAELHAGIVVGADGVGSIVRRRLGLPFGSLRAAVAEVDTERVEGDPAPDLMHVDGSDRSYAGYAWDFPTIVDGRSMVCRGVYALGIGSRAEPADATQLLRVRLAARGLELDRYRLKRLLERGFEPHRPFAAGRVMLVGEAAGIDAWSGEGIAQAIAYGELAGNYLAEKLAAGGRTIELSDWIRRVRTSKLGLDLAMRSAIVRFVYGAGRDYFDDYYASAPEALDLMSAVFAGRRPPLRSTASAMIKGALHATKSLVS